MKTSYYAVLHIDSSEDSLSILLVGGRVLLSLRTNSATFPNPDPSLDEFAAALTLLDSNLKLNDGGKNVKFSISDESQIIFDYLKDYISYVNKIAKGDKTIINLSGFESNSEAVVHSIPLKTVIKRIENGSTEHSAKIFVYPVDQADRYKVEITTTPLDLNSFKLVINSVSRNNLEVTGLVRAEETYMRVAAGNTHGWGPFSDFVGFVPQ
jgi:hypothetical protein